MLPEPRAFGKSPQSEVTRLRQMKTFTRHQVSRACARISPIVGREPQPPNRGDTNARKELVLNRQIGRYGGTSLLVAKKAAYSPVISEFADRALKFR